MSSHLPRMQPQRIVVGLAATSSKQHRSRQVAPQAPTHSRCANQLHTRPSDAGFQPPPACMLRQQQETAHAMRCFVCMQCPPWQSHVILCCASSLRACSLPSPRRALCGTRHRSKLRFMSCLNAPTPRSACGGPPCVQPKSLHGTPTTGVRDDLLASRAGAWGHR